MMHIIVENPLRAEIHNSRDVKASRFTVMSLFEILSVGFWSIEGMNWVCILHAIPHHHTSMHTYTLVSHNQVACMRIHLPTLCIWQ
jgi:hypothetical protein